MTDVTSTIAPTAADRLAAIAAQRAKLKEQLDAINAETAEARELAAAELDLANETALVAAAAKFGPINEKWAALMTTKGVIIVKRASDAKFKQFQEDPQVSFEAVEAYVSPCVEHPSQSAFAAIYRELPGVLHDVALTVNHLMGVATATRLKK